MSVIDLIILIVKLKVYGVEFGRKIRGNAVYIRNEGKIIIGDDVMLKSYQDGEFLRTGLQAHCKDAVIKIGSHTKMAGTMIHSRTLVDIGQYCMLAPGTKIIDNDSHRVTTDTNERWEEPDSKPVVIKDNVWICMDSLILKGVTIGENSVVAARSVVTKDIPPNSLAAGIPAKVVRKLK